MSRRIVEIVTLLVLFGFLAALAVLSAGNPPSTYSTYDTGRNGYRALFDVLQREDVPVTRLEVPLAQRPAGMKVLAVTPGLPAFGRQIPIYYDRSDAERIDRFLTHGGTVLAFGTIPSVKPSKNLHLLDVTRYTNAALRRDPRAALTIYQLVAGRGLVAFDERLHGYDRTQSLWSVLPRTVQIAAGLAALAVVLALIEANVRFAPPVVDEPPADRDSSDYVISMARLLRRAHAGRAAIERFARAYPNDRELQALALQAAPSDAAVLRAAAIFSERRKDQR